MKTIISGSSNYTDWNTFLKIIGLIIDDITITEVICGGSEGVGSMGERWAKQNKIPVRYFSADWDKHGESAGMIRNIEMVKYADAAIIIWDGNSLGTKHMIDEARKEKLRVRLIMVER